MKRFSNFTNTNIGIHSNLSSLTYPKNIEYNECTLIIGQEQNNNLIPRIQTLWYKYIFIYICKFEFYVSLIDLLSHSTTYRMKDVSISSKHAPHK